MAKYPDQVTQMPSSKLTMRIDGPCFPIDKFQKALQSFSVILSEIDKELSDKDQVGVEWAITEVTQGSLVITAEGTIINENVESERPQEIIKIFESGLECIKKDNYPRHFTAKALKNIKVFSKLISPKNFAEIEFYTRDWRFKITENIAENITTITQKCYKTYGSIEGELVSISIANRPKIGIRNVLDKKIVPCFFSSDKLFEQGKDALGERVYVFGLIRQHLHREKIDIQVEELKVFPNESTSISSIIALIGGKS